MGFPLEQYSTSSMEEQAQTAPCTQGSEADGAEDFQADDLGFQTSDDSRDDDDENDGDHEMESQPGRGHPSTSSQKQVGVKKARVSMQSRAGLVLPVPKVLKALKKGGYTKKRQVKVAVYFTAVIEYVIVELLELAANIAREQKRMRIVP